MPMPQTMLELPILTEHAFSGTLAAASTGAEWAWRAIHDDLAVRVTAFMRARGAPDPEDLASEVFLQMVRDIHSFDGTLGEFRAWAFRIARNRLIDDARRRAARPVAAAPPETIETAADRGDVEEEALELIAQDHVNRILRQLSPEQREVLLLRVLGGLTSEEAGLAMGKSSAAVRVLQHRALKALRGLVVEKGVTL